MTDRKGISLGVETTVKATIVILGITVLLFVLVDRVDAPTQTSSDTYNSSKCQEWKADSRTKGDTSAEDKWEKIYNNNNCGAEGKSLDEEVGEQGFLGSDYNKDDHVSDSILEGGSKCETGGCYKRSKCNSKGAEVKGSCGVNFGEDSPDDRVCCKLPDNGGGNN